MLRWLQAAGPTSRGKPEAAQGDADEQACPGLARALTRILAGAEQPDVLDLGQFSRSAALYLAHRGARVCVEDFVPPQPTPPRKAKGQNHDEVAPPVPVTLPHPPEKFDLVLAWEHWDFVPPDRLAEFSAEIARVLAPGGWLLMYCQDDPTAEAGREGRAGCYHLRSDDRLHRQAAAGPARPRWTHPNRAIERALAPLTVQSICLQRNRIREILARKPAAAS
jgi:SAM-dependent methyltransferase